MTARAGESDTVLLDLNNSVFQRQIFALEKAQQLGVLATLRKLAGLRWPQVYPMLWVAKFVPLQRRFDHDYRQKLSVYRVNYGKFWREVSENGFHGIFEGSGLHPLPPAPSTRGPGVKN